VILAQLSDPHLRLGPGEERSAAALAAGVRAVAAWRPAPDALLVTGDLANEGSAAEYERVLELLAPLEMPVHVLGGNHDDRDALRAAFPVEGDGPYRYAVDVGGHRLIACDSSIPGRPEGRLDLEWLEAQLGDGPAIIAMHHPPFDIGMPGLDEIGLDTASRAGLAELLARSPQVRLVTAGHVHRAASTACGGRPAFACPSVHLATRLQIGAPGYEIGDDPPAFALHVAVGDAIVSHVQPIG
jgi:Icc protein